MCTQHTCTTMISTFCFVSTCLALTMAPKVTAACQSNSTHIAWSFASFASTSMYAGTQELRSLNSPINADCDYERHSDAGNAALQYLRRNIMAFDLSRLETLGFGSDDGSDIDGLSGGIVGPTVELALACKSNYSWTDALPKSIFYEYVLNYANTNEARTNWRPLLADVIQPILRQYRPKNAPDIVKALNTHIWTMLAPKNSDSIVFVGGQTPLIYDPMSVIAFGYASCTGLAILFVNALRAAGVAARVVGTPAWMGDRNQGNHNWIEVYHRGAWYFMEPSPKQATIDTLERDPCERWFCHPDRFGHGQTTVFAARLDQRQATTHYPLAWEWNSTDVPGIDRTEYYTSICSKC